MKPAAKDVPNTAKVYNERPVTFENGKLQAFVVCLRILVIELVL